MAKYEYDSNLKFLEKCTNEELEGLFNILVYDKDGKKRKTEELTKTISYKRYGKNFSKYWKDIAGELQYYGGNTIANAIRRYGVEYEEILDDVLNTLKIDSDDAYTIKEKENLLLQSIFFEMVENMNIEQKKELVEDLNLKILEFSQEAILIAVQELIKAGGVELVKLVNMIVNYASKIILKKRGIIGAKRILGFLVGPIELGIASPAMRVTIPATVMVSCLRKMVEEREKNESYIF